MRYLKAGYAGLLHQTGVPSSCIVHNRTESALSSICKTSAAARKTLTWRACGLTPPRPTRLLTMTASWKVGTTASVSVMRTVPEKPL